MRVVAHRGQIVRYLSECMRRYVNIWPHYQHNLGPNPAHLMNIVAGSRLLGPTCQHCSGGSGSSGRLVGDVMMYNTPCGKRPQSICDSAMTLLQTGLQTGDIMDLIVSECFAS